MSLHDDLPHIDEHSVVVEASAEACWSAIADVVPRAFSGRATGVVARALGCADTAVAGPRPIVTGSKFPGFRVSHADRPTELALEGRHRLSRYSLVFRVDVLGPVRSRLRAETRATFPPGPGRLYRALVIGTRGHVLVVRRLLARVRQCAERHDDESHMPPHKRKDR